MTVRTQLIKLKVEKEFQRKYKNRFKNVDMIWYKHESDVNEQLVQLITPSEHPVLDQCGTMNTIDRLISTLPVCQDAVKDRNHKPEGHTPQGPLHPITTIMTHSGLNGDRDFLKSRMKNVRDKWVTKEKLLEINNDMKKFGYDKGIEVEEVMNHPTKPISYYRIKIGELESG